MTTQTLASRTLDARPQQEAPSLRNLTLTAEQVINGRFEAVEVIDSFQSQLEAAARAPSRQLADLIHRWLAEPALVTTTGSTGESCTSALVNALISMGFPYAMELSPELLAVRQRPRRLPWRHATTAIEAPVTTAMAVLSAVFYVFLLQLLASFQSWLLVLPPIVALAHALATGWVATRRLKRRRALEWLGRAIWLGPALSLLEALSHGRPLLMVPGLIVAAPAMLTALAAWLTAKRMKPPEAGT